MQKVSNVNRKNVGYSRGFFFHILNQVIWLIGSIRYDNNEIIVATFNLPFGILVASNVDIKAPMVFKHNFLFLAGE